MPDIFDIYLDDYQLHSLSTQLPTIVGRPLEGLSNPDIRTNVYDNPGDHGQTVTNALYGERVISLTGSIRGADVTEYQANRRAFQQSVGLQHDANGYPVFRILKLNINGNQYRIPVSVKAFDMPYTLPTSTKWKLDLVATKWALESEAVYSATVGLPQPGGLHFPTPFPITWTGSGGGSTTVTNAGTAAAFPVITIQGPVINPVLTNATTGERIALTLTLGASDTIVIDMFERTIIQGGATNRMGALVTGSNFWALVPGENIIYYSADAYDTSTSTLTWRSAFAGL